jgi:hypothetical protein
MVPSPRGILYTSKVIKGNAFAYTTRVAWCCLFSFLSVSFDGMGCEPVLNLVAATPDEAVSIICTIVDKTNLQLLGLLMYVSYTTDRLGGSVGHPAGALAIICLWVLLTWLTYAYGMIC